VACWFALQILNLLGKAQCQLPDVSGAPDVFAEANIFQNFQPVIEKAKEACVKSGHSVADHFAELRIMVDLGSGAKPSIYCLLLWFFEFEPGSLCRSFSPYVVVKR
jgi:hypothetical protein